MLEHRFKQGLGDQFYIFSPQTFFRARKKVTLRDKAQVSWKEKAGKIIIIINIYQWKLT